MFGILNLKEKVLGYTKLRVRGVTFTIKKLTPAMFSDIDSAFPFSIYTEKKEKPETADEKNAKQEKQKASINQYREIAKEVILRGVIFPILVKQKTASKKEIFIDQIMEDVELYNILFSAIFAHTFGVLKKKLISRRFKLAVK